MGGFLFIQREKFSSVKKLHCHIHSLSWKEQKQKSNSKTNWHKVILSVLTNWKKKKKNTLFFLSSKLKSYIAPWMYRGKKTQNKTNKNTHTKKVFCWEKCNMHEPAFFLSKCGWKRNRRGKEKKNWIFFFKNPSRNSGSEGASVPERRAPAALQQLMSCRARAPCAGFLWLWQRFVLERWGWLCRPAPSPGSTARRHHTLPHLHLSHSPATAPVLKQRSHQSSPEPV